MEAFQVQPVEALPQLIVLPPDDAGADAALSCRAPCQAQVERQVEGNRDRRAAVLARPADELGPSHPVEVCGVDHGQGARLEPRVDPAIEPLEGGIRRPLLGLVAGQKAAQSIGRDDRTDIEVPGREGRFPRARGADQQDEGAGRDADRQIRRSGAHQPSPEIQELIVFRDDINAAAD